MSSPQLESKNTTMPVPRRKKGWVRGMSALGVGIALFAFVSFMGQPIQTVLAISNEAYEKLQVFSEVYALIQHNYVEEVEDKAILYGAVKGMLESLDPHSSFLTPEDFKEMRVETRGEFGGLGIEISREEGAIKVVSPIEDTPAHQAGIKSGDLIVKINDETTKELSLMDAVKRMRGKPGSKITLTIIRKGLGKPLVVSLTRAVIKVRSVKSRMEGGQIGYIRVIQFNEQTEPLMTQAISDLKKTTKNGKLNGLVLDLRNNPGGLLDQAVKVSDMFIETGNIVSTKGRIPGKDMSFSASEGDVLDKAPMVVLINEGSASASEIVSGCLQDHKRAVILGVQSFGKGSVQTIMPLSDGSGMRLTTAKYYTPNGRSIQAKGIEPDIIVEDLEVGNARHNGDATKEADLQGHLGAGDGHDQNESVDSPKDEEKSKDETQPADKKSVTPKTEDRDLVTGRSKKDYQLQRALDLLKGYQVFSSFVPATKQTMVVSVKK